MTKFTRIIFLWVPRILLLPVIIFALGLLIQLAFLFFNFNPYSKSETYSFGKNYRDEYPVKINFISNTDGGDTTVFFEGENKSGRIYLHPDFEHLSKLSIDTTKTQKDTISWSFEAEPRTITFNQYQKGNSNRFVPQKVRFDSGVVYFKTENFKQRFYFSFPKITFYLLIIFCLYKFAYFLQYIIVESSFHNTNYKRLEKIGFALLAYQAAMMLFYWIFGTFSLFVKADATMKLGVKNVIQMQAEPNNDYGFLYILLGLLFLIFAQAFKYGNRIEEENELTV